MGEGLADNQPASCSNMATRKIYKEFKSKTIFKLNSFISKTILAVQVLFENMFAIFRDSKWCLNFHFVGCTVKA